MNAKKEGGERRRHIEPKREKERVGVRQGV
jgi:hypothetical protein